MFRRPTRAELEAADAILGDESALEIVCEQPKLPSDTRLQELCDASETLASLGHLYDFIGDVEVFETHVPESRFARAELYSRYDGDEHKIIIY